VWYRYDIVRQFRRSLADQDDVHSRLMRAYTEVPRWWFIAIGLISFVFGVVGIEVCNTRLPVWGLILAIIIITIFIIPLGMILAITNQQLFLNVLGELVAGFAFPGRPTTVMVFKTYTNSVTSLAMLLASDMKLGHYVKIPPRLLFIAQAIASVIAVIVSVACQQWALDNIPDICTPNQSSMFTCNSLQGFATGSIIWGEIGPRRLFSAGAM